MRASTLSIPQAASAARCPTPPPGTEAGRGWIRSARSVAPAPAGPCRRARRRPRAPSGADGPSASLIGMIAATQASVPSKSSAHSAWVRLAKRSVISARSSSIFLGVEAVRGSLLDAEQRDEGVEELRLECPDRHVLAVGRLVDVVVGPPRRRGGSTRAPPCSPPLATKAAVMVFRCAVLLTIAASTTCPSPLTRASSRAASRPMTRYVDPPPKSPTRLLGKCGRDLSCPSPCRVPVIAM